MLRDGRLSSSPGIFWVLLFTFASFFNVGLAAGRELAGESPFAAKASLIRYWKKHVSKDLPDPFFLNKASPLDGVKLATFSKLADQHSLSTHLATFCKEANLFCFPDVTTSLAKHSQDVDFTEYKFQNFTNYGTDRHGGVDSFKNYTINETFPIDTFRRYSRGSFSHDDKFTNYALDSLVTNQTFNNYGTKATGGTGDFNNYNNNTTVFDITFSSYSENTNGRTQDFQKYTENKGIGNENFTSYGKNGGGATNEFNSYGENPSGITSTFNNYGENGIVGNDNFTSYGLKEGIPENHFKSYALGGNGSTETFTTYGSDNPIPINTFQSYGSGGNMITQKFANYFDQSTSGHNSFRTYAAGSNASSLGFSNYGPTTTSDPDTFKGYAKDSNGQKVDFKEYKVDNTFKDYAKTGVTFSSYTNETGSSVTAAATKAKKVNRRWVEPGKFFREKMLKTGTVMPMPDIRDKMPERSFLPRAILSKIPFSSGKIDELRKIFHAADDSSLSRMMGNAMSECERAPSPGETKRCAGSGEDMIDFATSVLGRNVAVRSTDNTQGSGEDIMIGTVRGINGGRLTKSVSCHQSLYPYLLYYCHSVPKVRVYEADILDPKSKSKINHGVAICHIDTSGWSQNHGAFVALGSGPGKIEVCHWIFENDMTWTISD